MPLPVPPDLPWAPAALFTGVAFAGRDGLVLLVTLGVIVATWVATRPPAPEVDAPELPAPPVRESDIATDLLPAAPAVEAVDAASAAADQMVPPPVAVPAPRAPARRRVPRLTVPARLAEPRVALPLLGAGLAFVVLGQRLFAVGNEGAGALWLWLLGLAAVAAATLPAAAASPAAEDGFGPLALDRRTLLPVALGLGAGAIAFTGQRTRALDAGHTDIVLAWLAGMALVIAGAIAANATDTAARLRGWWQRYRLEVGLVAAVTLLAVIPTFLRFDSYPWTFNGDEGQFALAARDVLDRRIVNPFGVGFQAHPSLFFYLQAASLRLVGDDVAGARAIGALFGVLCVPVAYLLARRLSDGNRLVALAAAVLLGTFHVQLFWARSAQNNIAAVFFVLLAIYLLDRSRTGGAGASLATGLVLGLAQYFYVGGRVLPVGAVVTLVATAAVAALRGQPVATAARGAVVRFALMAAGFAVAVAPLYAHYRTYPSDFSARIDTVSIFATGWYDQQQLETGRGGLAILLDQFGQAAMLPFRTQPAGAYRGDPPFIGWPYALLGALGLAVLTAQWWRPRAMGIVAIYWGMVAGVALTVEPAQTSRSVAIVALLAVAVAVGLGATLEVLGRAVRLVPREALAGAGASIVLLTAAWSLHVVFRAPNQPALYSDGNTQVSEHMAREIVREGAGTVYFAGTPRMVYHGFPNLVFRTPGVAAIDFEQPLSPATPKPALDPAKPTLFVFLPERAAELEVVRGWFPNGVESETTQDGEPLYVSYLVRPPA